MKNKQIRFCSNCGSPFDRKKTYLKRYPFNICPMCEEKLMKEVLKMPTVEIAVFHCETNTNQIKQASGMTIIEAIVRAVEFSFNDEEIQSLIHNFGPDDVGGLMEYYEERGVYLSEPNIIS